MGAQLISRDEMIAEQVRLFDQLRTGSQRCFLIKRLQHTKRFETVRELTSGWFVSWDKFREQTLLRVAASELEFTDEQAQTSFIAYGAPDGDGEIDVYAISEPERDKVPPTETSPCWKFYLTLDEKERFEIP